MKLDISRALKDQGQPYAFSAEVTLPATEVMGDVIRFKDVNVRGEYVGAEESVSVTGDVAAKVLTRCSLCLADVEYPIETRLNAVFLRQVPQDDPDIYPMEGYLADIDKAVSDALLLELPIRVLCREDCKGLCPVCGVNRNVERCICQEGGEMLNPFSALSEMLSKNEEV